VLDVRDSGKRNHQPSLEDVEILCVKILCVLAGAGSGLRKAQGAVKLTLLEHLAWKIEVTSKHITRDGPFGAQLLDQLGRSKVTLVGTHGGGG